VGRILREKHTKPLIIDLIDNHDVFLNQFAKRRAFYNEKNYKIIRTNQENYNQYIKHLKSLNITKNNVEKISILTIEEELIFNIINNKCSPTFWNYLLYKSRKNNKNDVLNTTPSESKYFIIV
jgi:predicted transcriptional regulator